jgi:hypothetical protein
LLTADSQASNDSLEGQKQADKLEKCAKMRQNVPKNAKNHALKSVNHHLHSELALTSPFSTNRPVKL